LNSAYVFAHVVAAAHFKPNVPKGSDLCVMEVETTSNSLGGGGEDAELAVKAAVEASDVELAAEVVTGGVEVEAMEGDASAEGAPATVATTTPAVRVRRPIPAWPLVYYRVQPDNSAAEGDVLWYAQQRPLAVYAYFFVFIYLFTDIIRIDQLFFYLRCGCGAPQAHLPVRAAGR
jgi:hypothetical protein